VVLNKQEKEHLVVKLYQEGKSIREIAQQTHLSFETIGKIVRRINSQDKDETGPNDMINISKETQALNLFLQGKRPVDVAIELDLSSSKVENILQEFWVLNKLDELACIYPEIKAHLDLFLQLFHAMKKNKLFNQKDIKAILKYAHDLPSLENEFRDIANTVLDLEIKKKELTAQLLDLEHVINQYQNAIDMKRERLSRMEAHMSQPAIRYGKSKSSKSKSNE
jgi:DNA-binding CsgD family transcriptional regulator